jgi:DNA polymerase III alpha subunit
VGNYVALLQQYKPTSVEQLAMLLAVIRPAKRYLIGRSWAEIEREIWKRPLDGEYHYKKSHAVAYACSVLVQLNLLCERVSWGKS